MDQNTLEYIKTKLSLVPKLPGCYQMIDKNQEIIYVGKAKILQNRLRSYFSGTHDAKTTRMLMDVVDFEYIITKTETEAFLLECNFIKEYRPKYNILLMDDKSYPYICLTNETHPRLLMVRDVKQMKKKEQKLFGPFPNATSCRSTVEVLNKIYPFRKCKTIPKKSCLYYDIKQCMAPCINNITKEDYTEHITSVIKFLNGNNNDLLNELKNKMLQASEEMDYEKALEYRDIIKSIEDLQTEQKMTLTDGVNRDIFGYYEKNGIIAIQVLHMREGKVIERTGEVFDVYDDINDVLQYYIYHFYDNNTLPKEILIPYFEGYKILEELLLTKIIMPIKGTKKQLVDLVCENAKNNLDNLQKMRLIKLSKTKEPLIELSELLNINYPRVIELFDNSNIQGASAVSGMVVYVDGVPSPKDYRKYKIKTVQGADDYHTMQEVIHRRYSRVLKDNLRKPNLIIVDGGKTQVSAALQILDKLQITDIDLIGLLKDDNHKTKGIIRYNKNTNIYDEYILDKKTNLYLLLEAMQEEVHRYAITFFKQTHGKKTIASSLDNIPGLGKQRKKKLLENFDTIDDIANASIEKLKSLGIPEKLAVTLKETLKNRDN